MSSTVQHNSWQLLAKQGCMVTGGCFLGVGCHVTSQATAHEDLKRLLGKAQAIDELESTIPSFIEKLMPYNYPPYVHVLRVSHSPVLHTTPQRMRQPLHLP
jgi:hypothetical protein